MSSCMYLDNAHLTLEATNAVNSLKNVFSDRLHGSWLSALSITSTYFATTAHTHAANKNSPLKTFYICINTACVNQTNVSLHAASLEQYTNSLF